MIFAAVTAGETSGLRVLEVIAAYLVPITVGVLGYFVQRALNVQQNRTASLSRLADRRMQIFDEIKEDLNRIYCFVEDIGSWKEDTPPTVIDRKRRLDRIMHTNKAIWSPAVFAAFESYLDAAFRTHQGPGLNARIQTASTEKMRGVPGWQEQHWDQALTGAVHPEHRVRYETLVAKLADDLMLQ